MEEGKMNCQISANGENNKCFFNNWLIIYVSAVGTLKANIQKFDG